MYERLFNVVEIQLTAYTRWHHLRTAETVGSGEDMRAFRPVFVRRPLRSYLEKSIVTSKGDELDSLFLLNDSKIHLKLLEFSNNNINSKIGCTFNN